MASIVYTPAPDVGVMTVQVRAAATGVQVAAFVEEQVARQAAVAAWDWIFDLTQASGETGIEDTNRIARAMNDAPVDWSAIEPVTIFITPDPAFSLWAKAMDPMFYTRVHRVAHSMSDAQALLVAHRAKRGYSAVR